REIGVRLLDRGAELGLLTALGGGYYAIHPAVPWFLHGLFAQYYGATDRAEAEDSPSARSLRAYAEAMSAAGNHHIQAYDGGRYEFVTIARVEEGNSIRAFWNDRRKQIQNPKRGALGGARLAKPITASPRTPGSPRRSRPREWPGATPRSPGT